MLLLGFVKKNKCIFLLYRASKELESNTVTALTAGRFLLSGFAAIILVDQRYFIGLNLSTNTAQPLPSPVTGGEMSLSELSNELIMSIPVINRSCS